ncbi:MAG: hypothetical protein KGJ55_05345 [Gammaproteobacteria bacterium]|nr:hypothetical protein [Gammaproteobacteria bacterium]
MDPLTILSQLGLGVASSGIYDALKSLASGKLKPEDFPGVVQNQLRLHGISMHSETVVNALVQNGFLSIQGSHLHANQALIFGSERGAALFGNNSAMTTKKTAIHAGAGAFIEAQGNAQIRHNPDGSISFHVGEKK